MVKIGYKLPPTQVVVIDSYRGQPWIYDVSDPDELDFLSERGTRDEDGNLILTTPIISGLKKFTVDSVMNYVDDYIKDNGIPELS